MDKFSTLLSERFGASLAENFQRQASYFAQMDFLEYVSEDTTVIADRVDEYLTVLRDADHRQLIGFRVKGFGHAFNTVIRPQLNLRDDDFIPIVEALQRIYTDLGKSLFPSDIDKDKRRIDAYQQARDLASRDDVKISARELAEAA